MTTIRENIIATVITNLTNTTGVGNRIYRSRTAFVARAETPAIIVEPVEDNPSSNTSLPTLDWELLLRCVVYIRSDTADIDADPVIESLHSKIMADLTLNGYAQDIMPSKVAFEFVDADKPAAVITCDYLVRYRTNNDSLSS